MRVLLTNDDGIGAVGLQTLRRGLVELPDLELVVIAPDSNRSATARSITTRGPLAVQEVHFKDGTVGYATDGTPVDCVRIASLGLVEGFKPDLIVSGINHGLNAGDDITYSGTVAAAFEAIMLGLPGIAVSQQSTDGEMDFDGSDHFDFSTAARFVARIVENVDSVPIPPGTLLNINVPAEVTGVCVASLGKRIYRDELTLMEQAGGRRTYHIYGSDHSYHDEPGTDLAMLAQGKISVTPVHFDLTDRPGIKALQEFDLAGLLMSAASEVE